jgi:hypothetical protein
MLASASRDRELFRDAFVFGDSRRFRERLFRQHAEASTQDACAPQSGTARPRYFFTTSAFSIIAMPPRSAILPFKVIVFPQYSAN